MISAIWNAPALETWALLLAGIATLAMVFMRGRR